MYIEKHWIYRWVSFGITAVRETVITSNGDSLFHLCQHYRYQSIRNTSLLLLALSAHVHKLHRLKLIIEREKERPCLRCVDKRIPAIRYLTCMRVYSTSHFPFVSRAGYHRDIPRKRNWFLSDTRLISSAPFGLLFYAGVTWRQVYSTNDVSGVQ